MFVWIAMWLNQMMFSSINQDSRDVLQALSFIELLTEVAALTLLITIKIMDRMEDK